MNIIVQMNLTNQLNGAKVYMKRKEWEFRGNCANDLCFLSLQENITSLT